MAVSIDSTVLPRRTLLAGAAAALAAAPVMMALPARAEIGDPVFADMKRRAVDAWAKLKALYADQERRVKAFGAIPELPAILRGPLVLPTPGKGALTAADKDGWSARSLSDIVRTGLYFTVFAVPKGAGTTMRTEWKPVSAKTRKQAAELLRVREAYDAEHEAWWDKVRAIEDEATAPLAEAIDFAFALTTYPVFTVAEVKDKLALVEEWDLYNLTEVGDESLRDNLIRDALAAAEKAVTHV